MKKVFILNYQTKSNLNDRGRRTLLTETIETTDKDEIELFTSTYITKSLEVSDKDEVNI